MPAKSSNPKPATNKKLTQGQLKRAITVGPKMGEVSTAMYWYKNGHFANEDEARGAFKLAHQQGLDAMGGSLQQWMGLTEGQFAAWMRNDALPSLKGRRRTS